jgi:hypothetical protein
MYAMKHFCPWKCKYSQLWTFLHGYKMCNISYWCIVEKHKEHFYSFTIFLSFTVFKFSSLSVSLFLWIHYSSISRKRKDTRNQLFIQSEEYLFGQTHDIDGRYLSEEMISLVANLFWALEAEGIQLTMAQILELCFSSSFKSKVIFVILLLRHSEKVKKYYFWNSTH